MNTDQGADARENTPRPYRHQPSKWPMIHPDTGKIITVPANHAIVRTKAPTEAKPWWEEIQMGRDYVELLTRPEWNWSLFGHLTFKEPIHPESADKIFMKWVHTINRRVFGVRYWNRKETDGVIWARALEMQKREVIHFHFLMARVHDEVKRLWMMDEWGKLAGFARIHPYEAGRGAEQYICKYVAKGGEIEFGGPIKLVTKQLPMWE